MRIKCNQKVSKISNFTDITRAFLVNELQSNLI